MSRHEGLERDLESPFGIAQLGDPRVALVTPEALERTGDPVQACWPADGLGLHAFCELLTDLDGGTANQPGCLPRQEQPQLVVPALPQQGLLLVCGGRGGGGDEQALVARGEPGQDRCQVVGPWSSGADSRTGSRNSAR